jgi:hypothetical protein
MRVAIVELADLDKQIELIKGVPKTVELGLVTMRLEPSNLIAGSPFILSPRRIFCSRNIGGASPLNSEYMLRGRFDGFCLSVELLQNSTSLQNKNLATPVRQLGDDEEIVISIPAAALKFTSTFDLPSTSTELPGRFTLRDRRADRA